MAELTAPVGNEELTHRPSIGLVCPIGHRRCARQRTLAATPRLQVRARKHQTAGNYREKETLEVSKSPRIAAVREAATGMAIANDYCVVDGTCVTVDARQ